MLKDFEIPSVFQKLRQFYQRGGICLSLESNEWRVCDQWGYSIQFSYRQEGILDGSFYVLMIPAALRKTWSNGQKLFCAGLFYLHISQALWPTKRPDGQTRPPDCLIQIYPRYTRAFVCLCVPMIHSSQVTSQFSRCSRCLSPPSPLLSHPKSKPSKSALHKTQTL